MNCAISDQGRKRKFWTFQPCDKKIDCGYECETHGLARSGSSIDTTNYIRSLAISILMTNGSDESDDCRPDHAPRGGHWSQSYTGANTNFGSTIRMVKPLKSVNETISAIRAAAQADLSKIVTYGIASNVEAEVVYLGNSTYGLNLRVEGPGGQYEFDLSGVLSDAGFFWN